MLLTAAGLVWLGLSAPATLELFAYSAVKVCAGISLGYWADRSLFPGARPVDLEAPRYTQAHDGWRRADLARMRRALIVSAVLIALALGV